MPFRDRRLVVWGATLGIGLLLLVPVEGVRRAAIVLLALLVPPLLVAAAISLARRVLWRVGGRLGFSYFLAGVVPIPLVVLLLFVATYLLSGFFLGHLYRQAAHTVHDELQVAANTRMAAVQLGTPVPAAATAGFNFGYYRDGRRVGGDQRTPAAWPQWLEDETVRLAAGADDDDRRQPPLVALDDGELTMAAAVTRNGVGVVAFYDGSLADLLRQRSKVWIELYVEGNVPASGPGAAAAAAARDRVTTIRILDADFVLQPRDSGERSQGLERYLASHRGFLPLRIIGFELGGAVQRLTDGEVFADRVSATLTGTPDVILRRFFSSAPEVDSLGWLAFLVPAFLLFDIYLVAALMAVFMIRSLSRAVNRLSTATHAIQAGDFSARIPVKRHDQIGALHESFNQMAANLEQLVATRTEKELLERELRIAQQVQENLVPGAIEQRPGFEFATSFEPSAAIGGDYFDILEHCHDGRERLLVVIADVSGHGLPAGLRMAMLKATVHTLAQEGKTLDQLLPLLDRMLRRSGERRSFVTATLGLVDAHTGVLELRNAGHPPTYLVRGGGVEELLLPSSPLSSLRPCFAARGCVLAPGDVVVWLSDGVVEAAPPGGGPLGYERAERALRGDATSARAVRDRLLEAVHTHTGGRPPEDDLTIVVMRYLGAPATLPEAAAAAASIPR